MMWWSLFVVCLFSHSLLSRASEDLLSDCDKCRTLQSCIRPPCDCSAECQDVKFPGADEVLTEFLHFFVNGSFHFPANFTFPPDFDPAILDGVHMPQNYSLAYDNHYWHEGPVDDGIHSSMTDMMLHELLSGIPEALQAKLELAGILPNMETLSQLSIDELTVLPESIIKRLNFDLLADLSVNDVTQLLMQLSQGQAESIYHILSHLSKETFQNVLAEIKSELRGVHVSKSISITMISLFEHHFGKSKRWEAEIIPLLSLFESGLNAEQIRGLTEPAFTALLTLFSSNGTSTVHALDKPEHRAIVTAGMRHWGRVPYWDKEKLLSLGHIIMEMTPGELRKISPSIMMEILPQIGQYNFEHSRGRVIISVVTRSPKWEWSASQVKNLGNLTRFLHGKEIQNLPADVVSAASTELARSVEGRGSQVRSIATKITEVLGDVRTWDKDDIKKIGRAASGLTVKDLKELPASALVEAVSDVAQSDFSRRQSQVIMKKFKKGRQNAHQPVSAMEVKELGSLVAGLKSSDFKEMDTSAIRESLKTLREAKDKMDKTQKFEIMRKLKRSEGGIDKVIVNMGDLATEVPLKALRNVSVSTLLGSDNDGGNYTSEDGPPVSDAGKIKWTKSQTMMMFREIVKKSIAPTGSLQTIGPDTIRYMGTLMLGMTCEDISGLLDDSIISIAGAMMEHDGWTDRQLLCLVDKIRNAFSKNFTATFSESDVVQLTGQLLKKFTVREITRIPAEEREIAYASIGQEELRDVRPLKRKQLARHMLRDRGKESARSEVDSEDIDVFGSMICDMDAEVTGRMSSDAFNNAIYNMHECCFTALQRAAVRSRIIEEKGAPSTWTSDQLTSFGTLMTAFEENEIESIDKDEFSTVAEEIMHEFGDFLENKDDCARDTSPENIAIIDEGFKTVAISAKDALVAAAESSRRKRATYSPTCDEIEILGEGNVAWTVEELAAMETVEFDDCVETLGQIESFTAEQLDVLLQKATETWGEADEMSPTEIQQLGRIASRFSISDIGKLNLTDNDAVYAIAVYDIWTPEQLTAAFDRYYTLNGVQLSTMEASTLVALANFVCGMTASQIDSLPFSSYGDAASVIGDLVSCDSTQWAAFKNHAIAVYGAISTWEPDVYAEIGSVIAGFTVDDLGNIDNNTLAGVRSSAITLIPADTFADGFSAAVLQSFDSEQADAVSELQRAALSSEQLAALTKSEYGEEYITTDSPVTSGAVEIKSPGDISFLFVIILTMLTILKKHIGMF